MTTQQIPGHPRGTPASQREGGAGSLRCRRQSFGASSGTDLLTLFDGSLPCCLFERRVGRPARAHRRDRVSSLSDLKSASRCNSIRISAVVMRSQSIQSCRWNFRRNKRLPSLTTPSIASIVGSRVSNFVLASPAMRSNGRHAPPRNRGALQHVSASISLRTDRDSSEHRSSRQTHVGIDCVTWFSVCVLPLFCTCLVR